MRFFLAVILSTQVFINTFSQKINYACNYTGSKINESSICNMLGFKSRPEAIQAVNDIVSRSGLKQNFYIMECPNIDNCFAAVREGERLIVYDAAFMKKVNNLTNTDWGAMSILAHEIGHHLQGHTLKEGGSEQSKEIEADEFSGFVMYQLGANLNEAQSAIWRLTTDYDTGTHPPRSQRMGAVKRGYDNAMKLYPAIQAGLNKKTREEEPPNEVIETTPTKNNEVRTGCLSGNCENGYGIAVNKYTLEKYAGGWDKGTRTGFGIEFYKNGEKKYEGDFLESKYAGKGRYYFENGDKFEGYFKNGQMNGEQNVYYYKNGDRLFVRYINGQKHGKAKIIFANGTMSSVYFKDDNVLKR